MSILRMENTHQLPTWRESAARGDTKLKQGALEILEATSLHEDEWTSLRALVQGRTNVRASLHDLSRQRRRLKLKELIVARTVRTIQASPYDIVPKHIGLCFGAGHMHTARLPTMQARWANQFVSGHWPSEVYCTTHNLVVGNSNFAGICVCSGVESHTHILPCLDPQISSLRPELGALLVSQPLGQVLQTHSKTLREFVAGVVGVWRARVRS